MTAMISFNDNLKQLMISSLTRVLNSITSFPENEIEELITLARFRNIKKGDYFIREGYKTNSFAFVYNGLFRYYYIDKKGNHFTKGFFAENSIISAYSALIQNRESYFSIEALEDSKIMEFNYNKWKLLVEDKLCWQKFLLFFIEKGYCTKESREREFLLYDSRQRYESFQKTFPGLDKRVKQHIIASYLGITPVALSRIKNKRKH